MPENGQTNSDSKDADKNHNSTSHAGLWWIIIAGVLGLVVLLFVSIYLPNLTERAKFFTANALSLLVLGVIAVQAYIYRRQWESMKQQGLTMQGQLIAMKEHARIMSESLIETRNIAKTAEDTVYVSERAYIGIAKMILAVSGDIPTGARLLDKKMRNLTCDNLQLGNRKAKSVYRNLRIRKHTTQSKLGHYQEFL